MGLNIKIKYGKKLSKKGYLNMAVSSPRGQRVGRVEHLMLVKHGLCS